MKHLAEAIGEFTIPTLTDEEWAAQDARAAQLKADLERITRTDRASELIAKNWPRRAVEEAQRAGFVVHATQVMRAWDYKRQNIIVLAGTAGVGKTVAAAVWALERARVAPAFLHASEFAASSRFDSEDRAVWESSSALVVDDLGAEYADGKGHFLSALDELVNRYYCSRRPLVITTNLLVDQFKARYKLRISDRMREAARFVACGGASLRKRAEP